MSPAPYDPAAVARLHLLETMEGHALNLAKSREEACKAVKGADDLAYLQAYAREALSMAEKLRKLQT